MTTLSLLVKQYADAAIAHEEASKRGDYKVANREYAKLTRIYRKLEQDPVLAQGVISELFNSSHYSVLEWASAHALGLNISVARAEKMLEEISQMTDIGIVRLGAEMTLKEWQRKGKLTF